MLIREIINNKAEQLKRDQKLKPLDLVLETIVRQDPPLLFGQALVREQGCSIIAEIKRASPVKGEFNPGFDPLGLAAAYCRGGASAISVITEERFFKGSSSYMMPVKYRTGLPVLCKDFIIDQYQVYEARANGADALLLIVAILDKALLGDLLQLTHFLGMEALVEVHNLDELAIALEEGAGIIGINNRDLTTFEVNLATTLELSEQVPDNIVLVGESGINSQEDMVKLREAGIDAALIGEALVRAVDPEAMLKTLLNYET